MERIRVLLADDHAVLRAGLRMLLDAQPDMETVGEAADGEAAVERARELQPDVLLLDLTMPGAGGLPAIERVREVAPRTRVLVLTMHEAPAYVRSALAAGAAGYVRKSAADAALLSAIRAVSRGRTAVEPELRPIPAEAASARRPPAGQPHGGHVAPFLSPREREVLDLIAQGYTNQQIADRLALSVKTVETYRARLVDKLGLRSRADLVRYAIDSGLLGAGEEG